MSQPDARLTMTDTSQGLGPEEAIETIERAQSFDRPIRQRTEGVTWMIWGLVTAGLTLSFRVLGDYFQAASPPGWAYVAMLAGWGLVGVSMTFATWEIAAVSLPPSSDRSWRSALGGALWLPLVYLGIGVAFLAGDLITISAAIPIGIGISWLTLGAINPFRATSTGRGVLLAIGAVILLGSLIFALAAGDLPHDGWPAMRALAVLLGGGAPFLGGFWQTMRG